MVVAQAPPNPAARPPKGSAPDPDLATPAAGTPPLRGGSDLGTPPLRGGPVLGTPPLRGGSAPSSTPSPVPCSQFPAPSPSIPAPSPSAFLSQLLSTNFNVAALVETISPDQLLTLIQSPEVHHHLESLIAFTNTCLQLKQAQAKALALESLADVARTTTDLIEKRRAATALLRASNPAHPPRSTEAPQSASSTPQPPLPSAPSSQFPAPSASPPVPRSPFPVHSTFPAPFAHPSPDLMPEDLFAHTRRAIEHNNTPEPDTGLATIAALADPALQINGAPVSFDDPVQTYFDICDSPLGAAVAADQPIPTVTEPAHPFTDPARAESTHTLILSRPDLPASALKITLRRVPDPADPASMWRITKLDIRDAHPAGTHRRDSS